MNITLNGQCYRIALATNGAIVVFAQHDNKPSRLANANITNAVLAGRYTAPLKDKA